MNILMDEFINSLSIYKKIIEKLSKFLLKNNLISMNKTYIKISYQCINYSYNHRKRFFYTTPPPPPTRRPARMDPSGTGHHKLKQNLTGQKLSL